MEGGHVTVPHASLVDADNNSTNAMMLSLQQLGGGPAGAGRPIGSIGSVLSAEFMTHPYDYENWMLYNDDYPPSMLMNHHQVDHSSSMSLVNHAAISARTRLNSIPAPYEINRSNSLESSSSASQLPFSIFPNSIPNIPMYNIVNDHSKQISVTSEQPSSSTATMVGGLLPLTTTGRTTTTTMRRKRTTPRDPLPPPLPPPLLPKKDGIVKKKAQQQHDRREKPLPSPATGGVTSSVTPLNVVVPGDFSSGLSRFLEAEKATSKRSSPVSSSRRKADKDIKKIDSDDTNDLESDELSEMEDKGPPLDDEQQERHRKDAHIASEQKRRKNLNLAFMELRDCLPNGKDNQGLSRAAILRCAIDHVSYLSAFKEEADRYRKENENLKKLLRHGKSYRGHRLTGTKPGSGGQVASKFGDPSLHGYFD